MWPFEQPARRRLALWVVASWLVGAVSPQLVRADEQAQPVLFRVTTVHLSNQEGPADTSELGRRIDGLLAGQVPYKSLKILSTTERRIPMNEIFETKLPNGRHFRFRPMDVNANGVLVAVDVEEGTQGDFRVRDEKPLLLGGQVHQGGKLVVVVEPDY